MLYEIAWSTYDIRYIVIMLCFIPLLITFIFFQKRYDTTVDDVDNGIFENNARGSKSHTKFMFSLILIALMLASLSPAINLYKKNDAINCYKNGEYDTFTGIASHSDYYSSNNIKLTNESDEFSFRIDDYRNKEIKNMLQNDIKDGETYTFYFTYGVSVSGRNHYAKNILRIDKVN